MVLARTRDLKSPKNAIPLRTVCLPLLMLRHSHEEKFGGFVLMDMNINNISLKEQGVIKAVKYVKV